jgi:hypothetical protein
MDMDSEFYGKNVKEAVDCFTNNMEQLAKKKEKFLLENEIVFNKSYILNYNSKRASYRILNDLVLEETCSNIDEIFRECFKSLNNG